MQKLALSVAMLIAGAGLLVGAGFGSTTGAGVAGLKSGGIMRVGDTSDVDAIDPALAYGTTSWWLEYATAAKLFNYPDRPAPRGSKLVPEVASGVRVSRDGKTYTFTIRKGFRFSNGKPVTAKNFEYAINRVLGKDMASPGAAFLLDPAGTNIVGGKAVNDGKAKSARGVQVRGNKLIVELTRADGTFLAKIAMPFFQATSTALPLNRRVVSVSGNDLPSAGPYYVSYRVPNGRIELKRNPFYKRGPGRKRPHNLTGLSFDSQLNEQTGFLRVLANDIDQGPLPAANVKQVADRFGVNKSRFWVEPQTCVLYLAFNLSRPLFKGNLKLRQAVNYILRRKQIAEQSGLYGARTYSHILPPAIPGARSESPYPVNGPNVAKAKRLAKGNTRGAHAVFFHLTDQTPTAAMEIASADLARIGITAEPRAFRGFQIFTAAGMRGSEHDITQAGWCQDYPDPYDFINVTLYGKSIQAENNVNVAYFNDPRFNRKMLAASRKVGPARYRAYGKLDIDIMKNAAPWAVIQLPNNRFLFSNRVDPRSLVYLGVYQSWSIPALALK